MTTTTSGTIDSSSSDFAPWSTAFVFALVSLAVYRWILFPILSRRQPPRNNMGNTAAAAAPAASTTAPTSRAANHEAEQSEILTLLAQNATFPSHVAASTIASMATANAASSPSTPAVSSHQLLSNGLVAFRHTQAALYEPSTVLTSQVEVNRRDRARILSRMLSLEQPTAAALPSSSQPSQQQQQRRSQQQTSSSPSTSRLTPPLRGGTLVVSVPEEDVDCMKLRRILYLLGTFYNLLLVIVVEPTATTEESVAVSTTNHALQNLTKLVDRVRGTDPTALPVEVLPSHRIITASSVVGRVALVRQLARVELVLECDAQVQVQLQRFGFKVLVYGQAPTTPPLEDDDADENHPAKASQRKQPAGESLLGSLLLPGEL